MINKSENYTVVKKKCRKTKGGHSGTWKVAFADFAIAMMAFFLLMWVLSHTTAIEKQAISGYFKQPGQYSKASQQEPLTPDSITQDNESHNKDLNSLAQEHAKTEITDKEFNKLEQLKQLLERKIEQTAFLKDYKDQIYLDITNEGLRIQIFDNDMRAMFPRSSARLNGYAFTLLANLAELINQVDNRVSITGHTDAMPFQKSEEYTNWELSADRANAARNALVLGGLVEEKIARIVGLSSTVLFDAKDPGNSANRRISIIVLSQDVDLRMKSQEEKLNEEIKNDMNNKSHGNNI